MRLRLLRQASSRLGRGGKRHAEEPLDTAAVTIQHRPVGGVELGGEATAEARLAAAEQREQALRGENEQLRAELEHLRAELEAKQATIEQLLRATQPVTAQPASAHGETPLPPGLDNFMPLGKFEAVAAYKQSLKELEAAFFRSPVGSAAEALRDKVDELRSVLKSAIAERINLAQSLVTECHTAIIAGADAFTAVYDSVFGAIELTEGKGIEELRAELSDERRAARVKGGGAAPQQRMSELIELYTDAAAARPLASAIVKQIAAQVGVMAPAEPPLKATTRILEKSMLRPEAPGQCERICDIVRDMLTAETADVLARVVRAFLDCEDIEVVRVKDRFRFPSGGGWRDVMINYIVKADKAKHVCEVQLVHAKLLTARKGLDGHAIYNAVRNANELLERMGRVPRSFDVEVLKAVVQLEDKDGGVRSAAMRTLGELEPGELAPHAPALVAKLEHSDRDECRAAVQTLGKLDPAVLATHTPAFVAKLEHSNGGVYYIHTHNAAVAMLVKLEPEALKPHGLDPRSFAAEVVSALKMLEDKDAGVRSAAMRTLGELDPGELAPHAPALVAKLEDTYAGWGDYPVRKAAWATLGKLEPAVLARHAPALVAKLKDSNEYVRKAAVKTLCKLEPAALEALGAKVVRNPWYAPSVVTRAPPWTRPREFL